MKYEIFEFDPKKGAYQTDWVRVCILANKATAMTVAKAMVTNAHRIKKPLLVMTAPKKGAGKLVAEFN